MALVKRVHTEKVQAPVDDMIMKILEGDGKE